MPIIPALAAMLMTGAAVVGETCDISCKIEKALRGDGAAALEVAQESRRTQTPEIVANWLRIAAENGNATGQWEYGVSLVKNSQSRYDCIRAMYWFFQAGQKGHASAGAARRKVQEFLKEHPERTEGCPDAL